MFQLIYFNFFQDFIYLFLERGEGKEKGRTETSMYSCLSCTPNWWCGLQPRLVLWLGIEPMTLWFASTQSTEPHQPGLFQLIYITHGCSYNYYSRSPHICPNMKISWEQPPVQSMVHSNREWYYGTLRWRWAWEGEAPDFTFVDTGPGLCLLVPHGGVQCSHRTEQAQASPVPCLIGFWQIPWAPTAEAVCHPCVLSECWELWKQFQ